MNAATFFDRVRPIFGGSLTQGQVDGLNAVLDAWAKYGNGDSRGLAYVMAIAFHEVNFEPDRVENMNYSASRIREVWPSRFPTVDAARPYANNPEGLANKVYSNRLGNGAEASGDGARFIGRGLAQPTGRGHAEQFTALLGVNFVDHPELYLVPAHGARILVEGMTRGLFTGRKLADYFPPGKVESRQDIINARAIVNADVAANGPKIAGHYAKFLAAIRAAEAVKPAPVPQPTPPRTTPSRPPKFGLGNWITIIRTLLSLRKGSTMNPLGFLAGYRTYIIVGVLALVCLTEGVLGFDVPGVHLDENWLTVLLTSLGLGTLRAGIK